MKRLFLTLVVLCVCVLPAIYLLAVSGQAVAESRVVKRPRLFKDSRQWLASARAQGQKEVSLLIVAQRGRNALVAEQATRIGGEVRYRADDVDYLRVKVPIDLAAEFSEFDQIESASVDVFVGPQSLQNLSPEQSEDKVSPTDRKDIKSWPPKLSDYPFSHPYSPLKALNADTFLANHPTWDGRGVTIAVLDSHPDLLLPELQTAYTLDGRRVPKIADVINASDPRDDADIMPQWVDMHNVVQSQAGRVMYDGKTFTTPREGFFCIGVLDERREAAELTIFMSNDLDRNGNPKEDDGRFGVLWDEQTNEVWVDTNRNLSFADEKAMTDYAKQYDIGVLGKDDPNTPLRESVAFTIQTDKKNKFVSVNLAIGYHATCILGSSVGNRDPKGRFSGIAPGAQVVPVWYGVGNAHGLVEGLITAFRYRTVDLIVLEQHVGIASFPYLLADGHHPISIVAGRLTNRYNKLLFVPGGNSPGLGLVAEDGLAPNVVSVSGYQNADSFSVNWGIVPEQPDNIHGGSLSSGPGGLGSLKPELLAPSGDLSTNPGFLDGATRKELYRLPVGYSIAGGTSTATPVGAAAAALVMSAAKQSGLSYDAALLKAALVKSARYLSSVPAHMQGNGLIQVAAAVDLLAKLKSQTSVVITSRASVKTVLSGLLPVPYEGIGLFEREGWKAGDRGERTITLTRTTGSSEPMAFDLSWQGNDGTFTSPSSVTLTLNQPVDLPVAITINEAGVHSAILTLGHPSIVGPVYRILNTVVASLNFTMENGYTVETKVDVPNPGNRGVFFNIPSGVAALAVALEVTSGTSSVNVTFISPDRETPRRCDSDPGLRQRCSIANPSPGVWEINLLSTDMQKFDADRPRPAKPVPVKISTRIFKVDVASRLSVSRTLTVDSSLSLPLTLTNRLSNIAAATTSMSLGSAFHTRRSIKQGEQHIYEITLPAGSTSMQARVNEVADKNADLDIYMFYSLSPESSKTKEGSLKKVSARPPALLGLRGKAIDVGGTGSVDAAYPAAGRWIVVIDAFFVPSGQTQYDYLDVFTHPKFGAVAATDSIEERSVSASWAMRFHVWVAETPEAARQLLVHLNVTSPAVEQRVRIRDGREPSTRPWLIPIGTLDFFPAGVNSFR